MATESWLGLAAGILLAVAVVAQGLALRRGGGRSVGWSWLALIARGAAAAMLVAALVSAARTDGGWSTYAPRQVAVSLALAAILAESLLRLAPERRRVADAGLNLAGLFVDLFVLVLSLLAVFWTQPGGPALDCAERQALFQIGWGLLLLGVGGAIVAGGSGLALGLAALLARLDWKRLRPRRLELHGVLKDSTALALLTLGGGLVVGAGWAWQTVGQLAGSDPRTGWLAVAWLLAAMSWHAWRVGWRAGRWAAGLALAAVLVAVPGLFIL